MAVSIPKRISTTIMNALKGGVVPRIGLEYIAVGRKEEIEALLHDVDIIEDGGAAFRFIVGKFGSGKSFLLQTIRNYVMEKGFVVVDADLSPERRLMGNQSQGLATYKELMQNMSTKTKPDGGALNLILEKWIMSIQKQVAEEEQLSMNDPLIVNKVEAKIYESIGDLSNMVHGFDFAKIISQYWLASKENDENKKTMVLKWLRGEYTTKTEAKHDLSVNAIISDDDWYDYLKLYSNFLVHAGYKGMLVLIDELINIYKIPNKISRQYNYEKILTMYNDTLQGKAKYIGIIMGGTPQSIEDSRRGVFSYEALKSRLESGKFASEDVRDLMSPIIRLKPLDYEELFVLLERLAQIHASLYEYDLSIKQEDIISFLKIEFERIGANSNITPREVIRDFIELLNISLQSNGKSIVEILEKSGFVFSENTVSEEQINEEFAEFIV